MKNILACTDGSQYSKSIYAHAAWAAGKSGASVQVLHTIEREESRQAADLTGSIGFDASAELLDELVNLDEAHARVARLRGRAILDDARRQLEAGGVRAVETTQRHGSLVEALGEFEAGLVVLGKRGEHADFSRGHLGSNLERVARGTKIPLLVASRVFAPVERFLIAFDGGASALRAVHFAATEPLFRGAEAHLIAVGKPGSPLERELDNATVGLRGAGFQVTADLLSGHPDTVIAAEVERRDISLLVMGAYGHSHIRHLIIGSTTTALLRTCLVPAMLFR